MFGRQKRKDAPPRQPEARSAEAIITAATEPVLPRPAAATPPPPPAPAATTPPPAPVAATPPPPPPAPEPSAPPAAPSDELSSADIRARTLLADSIARMELSLRVPPPPPSALAGLPVATSSAAVEALADSVARTASEVARALEHVSSMCAMLSERLDADREERRALTEAIARLGVTLPATAETPSTVLGGTVYPTPATEPAFEEPEVVEALLVEAAVIDIEPEPIVALIEDEPEPVASFEPAESDPSYFAAPPQPREREALLVDDEPSVSFASPPPAREPEVAFADEPAAAFAAPLVQEPDVISLVDEEAAERAEQAESSVPASEQPTGAGMWCRDEDQWIGGVEIADFVSDNGTIRYWLRRTSDGQMLPRPFDATDLRFIRETAPSES